MIFWVSLHSKSVITSSYQQGKTAENWLDHLNITTVLSFAKIVARECDKNTLQSLDLAVLYAASRICDRAWYGFPHTSCTFLTGGGVAREACMSSNCTCLQATWGQHSDTPAIVPCLAIFAHTSCKIAGERTHFATQWQNLWLLAPIVSAACGATRRWGGEVQGELGKVAEQREQVARDCNHHLCLLEEKQGKVVDFINFSI